MDKYSAENRPVFPRVFSRSNEKFQRLFLPLVSKIWMKINAKFSAFYHISEKNDIAYTIHRPFGILSKELVSCQIEWIRCLVAPHEATPSNKDSEPPFTSNMRVFSSEERLAHGLLCCDTIGIMLRGFFRRITSCIPIVIQRNSRHVCMFGIPPS